MGVIQKATDWLAVQILKSATPIQRDASASNPDTRLEKGIVKRIGYRSGDVSSRDFEAPEFSLTDIQNGYNVDGYIRQGIDKYVDQIFKEGYEIYGKNEKTVEYILTRLTYMAEATGQPLDQFITEIAEDVVKYANAVVVKARMKDPAQIPQGMTVKGIKGLEPVVGYFLLNPSTMKVKRDKNGTILGWQQDSGEKPQSFKADDVVHFYYKRERGNAFGTPFLIPVLDDVRALRQAEENALRMLYRNIYPFYHIAVGEKDSPGQAHEVEEVMTSVNNMEVEGGLVTTSRVAVKAIAADQVVDAEPYLRYYEDRVFSGLGIPAIMFGRGGTANRSTGDSMSSEMSDRIMAIQKTIESFFNHFVVRELLLEGGYDPILNKEDAVMLRFHSNDQDKKIKMENHAIFKYEHNAITEDEMRGLLGTDPITDRSKMHMSLITIPLAAEKSKQTESGTNSGSKETNNKNKPTNQNGTKSSPKKQTNSAYESHISDLKYGLKDSVLFKMKEFVNCKEDQKKTAILDEVRQDFLRFSLLAMGFTDYYHDSEVEGMEKQLFVLTNDVLRDVVEYIIGIDGSVLTDSVEIRLDLFYDDIDRMLNDNHLFRKEA